MKLNTNEYGLQVKDVMTQKVISINGNRPVAVAAKLIVRYNIGSIFVFENDPMELTGIITKGDIISRVVAEALDPGIITCKEVASKPIYDCYADETLEDIMDRFSDHDVERLLVRDSSSDRAIGVISVNDIIRVAPELITTKMLLPKQEETPSFEVQENFYISGYCDDCKNYSDKLTDVGGYLLCPNCRQMSEEYMEREVAYKEEQLTEED